MTYPNLPNKSSQCLIYVVSSFLAIGNNTAVNRDDIWCRSSRLNSRRHGQKHGRAYMQKIFTGTEATGQVFPSMLSSCTVNGAGRQAEMPWNTVVVCSETLRWAPLLRRAHPLQIWLLIKLWLEKYLVSSKTSVGKDYQCRRNITASHVWSYARIWGSAG